MSSSATQKTSAKRRKQSSGVTITVKCDHFLGEFIEDALAKPVGKPARRKVKPTRRASTGRTK